MSKNTSFIPSIRFKIATRLAIILLCVSSSLVFSDITWAKKPTQEEIRNLIEKLDTNDEWERDKTIEELKKASEDAIPQLVKAALKHESLLVRISAKEAMRYSYQGIVEEELIIALEDTNIKIRRRAIQLLIKMGSYFKLNSQASKIKLTKLLNDKDSIVRAIATFVLGIMGEKAVTDEVIKVSIKLLNDKDNLVRVIAADTLGRMGDKAANDQVIKALTKLLNDKDYLVRRSAASALGRMGDKAANYEVIKALTKLLNDKDYLVRTNAASTLGRMNEKAANDEAIKALIKLLNDKDDSVRRITADALGRIGEKAATDEVITALIKLLNDKDDSVSGRAANVLGRIGEKAATNEVIKALTKLLNNKNDSVSGSAANALGRIGEKAATDEVIKALTKLLNNKNDSVRRSAADALGRISEKAATDEVIKALIKLLNDKYSYVHSSAANALLNIAYTVQDKAQANKLSLSDFDKYIPKLEKALKKLENSEEKYKAASLRRSLLVIKDKRKTLFWNSLLKNPFIIIPSAYLIFFPSLWFLLLRLKPISLIQINEILKPYEFCLPNELGGAPIRTRDLLLFSFFKFRLRVLDAWVEKNIPRARERFELKKTVQERSIHIPVAATLNNQDSIIVTGKHLKPTFNNNRACLLIWGEGGAGKTSLACQIGRWVMSDDAEKRPSQHLMLPVLIEEELRLKKSHNEETPLLEAIQGQLQDLIDSPKPIPQELLEQLLRQRRILVIVDHFSEMSDATRKVIHPDSPNFCINALVVTSRL
ncbi:MAG: HEAT repeat domain-containing protein, partial [Cyanobacteria bacterium P01_D01_bin.50]